MAPTSFFGITSCVILEKWYDQIVAINFMMKRWFFPSKRYGENGQKLCSKCVKMVQIWTRVFRNFRYDVIPSVWSQKNCNNGRVSKIELVRLLRWVINWCFLNDHDFLGHVINGQDHKRVTTSFHTFQLKVMKNGLIKTFIVEMVVDRTRATCEACKFMRVL